jgi:hypothetical protein
MEDAMGRRFYAAGSWVLVALGAVHLLGHYKLMTAPGNTEADRELLSLMRGNGRDMGLGMVRSTFDILAGFSLAFSILGAGTGLLGLVLLRHLDRSPGLLRQTAIAYACIYAAMSAVALRYWFAIPLSFLAAAFVLFAAAAATAPRGEDP